MISRQKTISIFSPEHEAITFSFAAKTAISQGIRRGDAVAELELLGLPVRTINLLEYSKLKITGLSELMGFQQEELLEIPNFGTHGLRELMQCLSRYHHLDAVKQQLSSAFDKRKVTAMQELVASGEVN